MTAPVLEFSRIFAVEVDMGAGDNALAFTIEATTAERAALARRFGLLALDSLTASGRIEVFKRGRRARLTATLHADATQPCVVSLEPVRAGVEDSFTVTYDRDARERAPEEDFDVMAEDPPDPLPENGIDVGAAVAEHFGLALNPYPRASGADVEAPAGPRKEANSPFSVLRRLKER